MDDDTIKIIKMRADVASVMLASIFMKEKTIINQQNAKKMQKQQK